MVRSRSSQSPYALNAASWPYSSRMKPGWALVLGGSLRSTGKPDASAMPAHTLRSPEWSHSQPRSRGYPPSFLRVGSPADARRRLKQQGRCAADSKPPGGADTGSASPHDDNVEFAGHKAEVRWADKASKATATVAPQALGPMMAQRERRSDPGAALRCAAVPRIRQSPHM